MRFSRDKTAGESEPALCENVFFGGGIHFVTVKLDLKYEELWRAKVRHNPHLPSFLGKENLNGAPA